MQSYYTATQRSDKILNIYFPFPSLAITEELAFVEELTINILKSKRLKWIVKREKEIKNY